MRQKFYLSLCMLFMSVVTFAQGSYTVKGSVVDISGQPIIGATIIEKGTYNAVASNELGQFTIKATSPESMIEIRSLSYKTIELMASSDLFKSPIEMVDDAAQIESVVVVGYGTLRKSDMTGAVAVVKSDLNQVGQANSAAEMLIGKVPGLQITPPTGRPGDGSTIRIRGGASLAASNNPLIVIDGVPVSENAGSGMSNPLAVINPNDIASYTVLKDASATAIYGSRGSNGVIIINTKKGVSDKFRLNYNSTYGVAVNSKTVQTLNGDQFADFMSTYYAGNQAALDLVGTDRSDWQGSIFRPAFSTDQFVSGAGKVTGKHNSLGYRASFGFTNQDGTLKNSNFKRYTGGISLSPRFLDDHLSVDLNLKATWTDERRVDGGVVGTAAFYNPTLPMYQQYPDNKYNGYSTIISGDFPNSLAPVNPMAMLNDQYDNNNATRSIGNLQIDYKMHFLPELRANLNLGYDYNWSNGRNGTNVNSIQAWRDSDYRGVGRYNNFKNQRKNELLDFYLNYTKDIAKNHIDVMLGYSWQHFYYQDYNESFPNDVQAGTAPFYSRLYATENYLVSFFGRLNYSYDNRYLITATLRNDGSSRFGPSNRWGLFPSVAVGWNLAQESWLKDSGAVSNMKIRASWGITGQQDLNLNDYPYLARYSISNQYSQYQFGDTFYPMYKPLAYDENIKWEETETWNAGLDLGFLENRIYASVDVYYKKTKDLLNTISVPGGSNFSNKVITNIGNLENRGVEVNLGADIIRTKDWNWSVNFNATWADTKITKLTATDDPSYLGAQFGGISAGTGTTVQIHAVGAAPSSFYVYQQVYGTDGKPLQNVVVDRDGDGTITPADRYIYKSPAAKMYYGISTELSFRNWDLAINGHGSVGNYMFNDFRNSHSTTQAAYGGQGFLTNVTDYYKETGFTGVSTTEQNTSDYWVEDASFFRLDNITLGYNFKDLFGAKNLNGRLSFTAQNVFVITKYSGLDPEGWGIDNVIWPRPRTFILGLNLTF